MRLRITYDFDIYTTAMNTSTAYGDGAEFGWGVSGGGGRFYDQELPPPVPRTSYMIIENDDFYLEERTQQHD